MKIKRCKNCGIAYDQHDLIKSFGEFSSVVSNGYCSSMCYTKNLLNASKIINKENKKNENT